MKKTNISIKARIFTLAILMLPVLGAPVMAADNADTVPVELKHVGFLNNLPVFQLLLNNNETSEFEIVIKDGSRRVIYRENIKGKSIMRKYQFKPDEVDTQNLVFEVYNRKSKSNTVYLVNNTTRTVHDLVINKQ